MDPRQIIQRIAQLKQELDALMQQLSAAGIPQEAVMAALSGQGSGQMGGPRPGMGPAFNPSAGVPGGPEAQPFSGGSVGGGMPQGLLGPG